ncbi:hypothetical protein [Pantoea wallisii]|uniref:hypothetical protein n=1 Tax=Pantoea wallisii TaxID=1076551 RepID=UPI000FFB7960|nr:hypothetical protein [Pantoea wallisii]
MSAVRASPDGANLSKISQITVQISAIPAAILPKREYNGKDCATDFRSGFFGLFSTERMSQEISYFARENGMTGGTLAC